MENYCGHCKSKAWSDSSVELPCYSVLFFVQVFVLIFWTGMDWGWVGEGRASVLVHWWLSIYMFVTSFNSFWVVLELWFKSERPSEIKIGEPVHLKQGIACSGYCGDLVRTNSWCFYMFMVFWRASDWSPWCIVKRLCFESLLKRGCDQMVVW